MAVNGIITMMNRNSSEQVAQFNFSKFHTNVMLDNIDRMNDTQKEISEELRDKLKNDNKNEEDGIKFSLYTKEDEDNPNEKQNTKNSSHHVILNPSLSMVKAPGRTSSPAECETCANRKYQDGSNENDVSFKTPSHIAPSIAASVILGHEHEHVANAYEKEHMSSVNHDHTHAHVDQASVRLKTDICPECGRVYFSGGVTNTVISYIDDEQYEPQKYQNNIMAPSKFKNVIEGNEYLNSLLNNTSDSKVKYFDDPNYDEDNPYIMVPLKLKDKLSHADYLRYLEELTNLKILYFDTPGNDDDDNDRYQPYKMFDEDYHYRQGSNVDINY